MEGQAAVGNVVTFRVLAVMLCPVVALVAGLVAATLVGDAAFAAATVCLAIVSFVVVTGHVLRVRARDQIIFGAIALVICTVVVYGIVLLIIARLDNGIGII